MPKKTVVAAVAAIALAAAGAATAAAVTHQSSSSVAAKKGTVMLHSTKLGKVLSTRTGMTLYLFAADRHGRSACYGKCATFWPPLLSTRKPTAGTGVKAKLLRIVMRKNGTHQVTYAGHPLYRFKLDKRAGQTNGEGQDFFGGKWWGLNSAGKAVKKSSTPPTTGTTTTTPTTTTNPYGY